MAENTIIHLTKAEGEVLGALFDTIRTTLLAKGGGSAEARLVLSSRQGTSTGQPSSSDDGGEPTSGVPPISINYFGPDIPIIIGDPTAGTNPAPGSKHPGTVVLSTRLEYRSD